MSIPPLSDQVSTSLSNWPCPFPPCLTRYLLLCPTDRVHSPLVWPGIYFSVQLTVSIPPCLTRYLLLCPTDRVHSPLVWPGIYFSAQLTVSIPPLSDQVSTSLSNWPYPFPPCLTRYLLLCPTDRVHSPLVWPGIYFSAQLTVSIPPLSDQVSTSLSNWPCPSPLVWPGIYFSVQLTVSIPPLSDQVSTSLPNWPCPFPPCLTRYLLLCPTDRVHPPLSDQISTSLSNRPCPFPPCLTRYLLLCPTDRVHSPLVWPGIYFSVQLTVSIPPCLTRYLLLCPTDRVHSPLVWPGIYFSAQLTVSIPPLSDQVSTSLSNWPYPFPPCLTRYLLLCPTDRVHSPLVWPGIYFSAQLTVSIPPLSDQVSTSLSNWPYPFLRVWPGIYFSAQLTVSIPPLSDQVSTSLSNWPYLFPPCLTRYLLLCPTDRVHSPLVWPGIYFSAQLTVSIPPLSDQVSTSLSNWPCPFLRVWPGIYFSAHWCPPCRGFTPVLAEYYTTLRAADKKFQVVFVSSDRDEASAKDYYSSMPWLMVPFADRAKKVGPSLYLFLFLSLFLGLCLFVCLSVSLRLLGSIYLSLCLYLYLPISISHLLLSLCLCLSVCLSVCAFLPISRYISILQFLQSIPCISDPFRISCVSLLFPPPLSGLSFFSSCFYNLSYLFFFFSSSLYPSLSNIPIMCLYVCLYLFLPLTPLPFSLSLFLSLSMSLCLSLWILEWSNVTLSVPEKKLACFAAHTSRIPPVYVLNILTTQIEGVSSKPRLSHILIKIEVRCKRSSSGYSLSFFFWTDATVGLMIAEA